MKKFYLGIGAPRCGTTWLYSNLRAASNLYLPPVKELRFFEAHRRPHEKIAKANEILDKPAISEIDRRFVEKWLETIDGDHGAYLSMFPDEKRVGEISPIYCTLGRQAVGEVASLLAPLETRVFMIVRNPYFREISHIKFVMHRLRDRPDPYDVEEYLSFAQQPAFRQRSHYDRAIGNWRTNFRGNFKLYYFDDLEEDMFKFFSTFLDDMNLSATTPHVRSSHINNSAGKKKPSPRLPRKLLKNLQRRNLRRIEGMEKIDPHYQAKWIQELEGLDL